MKQVMDYFKTAAGPSTAGLKSPKPRKDLDIKLIKASQRYQEAESIKEVVYEHEGAFPGKESTFICIACQKDDSADERAKVRLCQACPFLFILLTGNSLKLVLTTKQSRRFACKRGLILHLNGPFHSGYSHWRRLRKQDAVQVLAISKEMSASATASTASNNGNSTSKSKVKANIKSHDNEPKLTFHCPYPFCRSGSAGWSSLHELVAHVGGSDERTESLDHEQRKWMDGWGDTAWLMNEDASRMVTEVEGRYPD
jgi:hypothetical protein